MYGNDIGSKVKKIYGMEASPNPLLKERASAG